MNERIWKKLRSKEKGKEKGDRWKGKENDDGGVWIREREGKKKGERWKEKGNADGGVWKKVRKRERRKVKGKSEIREKWKGKTIKSKGKW